MGSFFGTNIGVDLGTANTLISVDGKGIVQADDGTERQY